MKHITQEKYIEAIAIVSVFEKQVKDNYQLIKKQPSIQRITSDTNIANIGSMSVRLTRCLMWYASNDDINFSQMKMSDFEGVSASRLLIIRTFGKGTLSELKKYCGLAGIKLTE